MHVSLLDMSRILGVIDTYREVLDAIGHFVEDFILPHAVWIAVSSKANHHQSVLFAQDSLVHMPSRAQMRKHNGTHVLALSKVDA